MHYFFLQNSYEKEAVAANIFFVINEFKEEMQWLGKSIFLNKNCFNCSTVIMDRANKQGLI